MARTPLALNETFRPWYLAGVTHFLQDSPCDVETELENELEETEKGMPSVVNNTPLSKDIYPAAETALSGTPVLALDSSGSSVSAGTVINLVPVVKESSKEFMENSMGKFPEKSMGKFRDKSAEVLQLPHTLPSVETWPSNWQKLYNALPSQASVVWTYWSFGVDIAGQPSLKRRAFIQDTLKILALPKGTFTFWPVALAEPQQESIPGLASQHLQARADIFLYGLQKMQPRYVLVFGSKAIEGFYPNHGLRHYQQRPFENMQLIMLPPLDMLAECNGSGAAAASCAYIQTALAQLYYK